MWKLDQCEQHKGYCTIGYVDASNEKYGFVMAMYRINVYGEIDFYYQYELDDDVVASFECWARRVIGRAKTKKITNATKNRDG